MTDETQPSTDQQTAAADASVATVDQAAENEALASTDQAAEADAVQVATENVAQTDAHTETQTSEAGDVVTVAVARGIFEQRHDVASVVTDQGILHRDGTLT